MATQPTKSAKKKAKKGAAPKTAVKSPKAAVRAKPAKAAKTKAKNKAKKTAPVAKAALVRPKLTKKPMKAGSARRLLTEADRAGRTDGASATPQMTAPLAGATVAAAVDLQVDVDTNRGDLGYIVELLDVTPAPMPAVANQLPVAAPAGNNFSVTFPAAQLAPGRQYRVRVFVDPAFGSTPPHQDHVIFINT